MNSSLFTNEVLIDYVEGLLSPAARERVELAAERDETIATRIAGIRTFYAEHGEDRDELERWLEPTKNTSTMTSTPRKIKIVPMMLRVGAAAALLFAVFWFFGREKTRHDVAEDFAELPVLIDIQVRGDEGMNALSEAYAQKQWEQVSTLAYEVEEETPQVLLMLGIAWFNLEDYPMTVATLSQLEESRYSEYAQWYIALSYALTDQNDRAEAAMQAILDGSGTFAGQAGTWLQAPL